MSILTIDVPSTAFDLTQRFMRYAMAVRDPSLLHFTEKVFDWNLDGFVTGREQLYYRYAHCWHARPRLPSVRHYTSTEHEQPFIDELYRHLGIPCPNLT